MLCLYWLKVGPVGYWRVDIAGLEEQRYGPLFLPIPLPILGFLWRGLAER